MGTRHLFPLSMALGFLAFSCYCQAAPVIDADSSPGAYLVKTRSGMHVMAEVNVNDDQGIVHWEQYRVEMTMPDGRKVSLKPFRREQDMLSFHLPALLEADEASREGKLTGDYVFVLKSAEADLLDTYTDLVVAYRDPFDQNADDFDEGLVVPANGTFITKGDQLVFRWNKIAGARLYEIKVFRGEFSKAAKPVFSAQTEKTQVEVPLATFAKDKYYWRLEALHEAGEDRDNVVRFTLDGNKRPFFYIK